MKRVAAPMFAVCSIACFASIGAEVTDPAEAGAALQDLPSVKSSNQIMDAQWVRQPDSYVILLVLDRSKYSGRTKAAAAQQALPVNTPTLVVDQKGVAGAIRAGDRSAFFLGNTIANLRGLDPWLACNRTLTMIDGRRTVAGQPPPPAPPTVSREKERRVEVWLLRSDGSQILPADYTCDAGPVFPARNNVEISYRYPVADGAQAAAVAVRIDETFYIEKLQLLASAPAAKQ